jgi:metallophosphoesterase superfamily enzyme
VASRSRERLDRLLSCIRATSPDLLILLGDVKHNLPVTSRQEYRELPGFLAEVRKEVPLRVVPGNHDTGIARFLGDEELLGPAGAVIDGTGYLHGHTLPSPSLLGRLIITGHHHPLVSVRDEVGLALRAPAYLVAALDGGALRGRPRGRRAGSSPAGAEAGTGPGTTRALFVPAFNECAGFDVTSIVRRPFSPVSRAIVPESAEVFLTDGTYLGPVAMLEDSV